MTKPFGRFVYNCRRRSGCQTKPTNQVDVPVSKVPKKFNMTKEKIWESAWMMNEGRTSAQQIKETSQGFLVSNTSCRIVATRANWPTHRKPAIRSDNPIPNLKSVETPMSKRTKARDITTLIHVSSLLAIGNCLVDGKESWSGSDCGIPVREK